MENSTGPHSHGSGFTPSRSVTSSVDGTFLTREPVPIGIMGTGGVAARSPRTFRLVGEPSSREPPPRSTELVANAAARSPGDMDAAFDMPSKDSTTAFARSSMNTGLVSSAGTRPHCSTPLSSASSLYSMSISSSVSMCSDTNEIGTATIAFVFFSPSSLMTSSV